MKYNLDEHPLEPMTLYSITDISRELGVSDATAHYWANKGMFPPPFAIASKNKSRQGRLWSREQLDKIIQDYTYQVESYQNKTKTHREGPKKMKKIAPPETEVKTEPESEIEVATDGIPECSLCGMPAFNLEMHMNFAHKGKYTAVGAKQ